MDNKEIKGSMENKIGSIWNKWDLHCLALKNVESNKKRTKKIKIWH